VRLPAPPPSQRSTRLPRLLPALLLLVGSGGTTSPAGATPARPAPDAQFSAGLLSGWHIVRPGEKLELLAERYVGDQQAWPQFWALNPAVLDPHRIYPGQRIRVLVDPARTRPAARVEQLSRRVESKPEPTPWERSEVGELLLARDGLRTFQQASAGLQFTDGTRLTLGESSLVFLRELAAAAPGTSTADAPPPAAEAAAPAPARTADRPRIEVRDGEVDVASAPTRRNTAVEIVLPAARATAEGVDSPLASRVRSASEQAQLMVYQGRGEVAAASERVELPAGTGTSIPRGKPPLPPEALLPPPASPQPAAGSQRPPRDLELSWSAVDGAREYLVEVCGDADCGAVVTRGRTTAPAWAPPEPLATGEYHWRVRAVSSSGLDGFPSPTLALALTAAPVDDVGPSIAVRLPETPWQVNGIACFDAAELAVGVEVRDEGCGVESYRLELDGRPIEPAELERGRVPGGAHALVVEARDRCGNVSRSPAVSFLADADPPTFLAESRAPAPLELGLLPNPARDVVKRREKWRRRGLRWLEWSSVGHLWAPLPTGADPQPIREFLADARANAPLGDGEVIARWQLDASRPWVFFTAPGGSPFASGGPELEAGRILWVVARDPGCGIAGFELRSLAARPGETPRVELAARDHFGRTTVLSWPLSASSPPP
jgi:hypothetical protein